MTRKELGRVVMHEFAERAGRADRDWNGTLLDRAIDIGREEVRAHVECFGVTRAGSNVDEYDDYRRMREHMPILV